ncbi:MAG: DUF4389 domain-containing protein [Candidatus Bilamarchaeaceae archaeon]
MKTIKYEADYEEHAGRLELLIRWIWAIPTVIVLVILGIIASIAFCVQWLYILILGKRNRFLFDWTYKYMAYAYKFYGYMNLLTDERNPIFPEQE